MKKKNAAMRMASLLLVLVTATSSLLGGTLAQYASSAFGADTATVAKWDVEVGGKDITQEDSISFDLFKTINDTGNAADETDVVDTKIAPGTAGSFTLSAANKSEVNAKGTITLTVDKPEGMALAFSKVPFADLPSGYTRLEYIQSSGSSWVNTTYYPNTNTRVVADVQFPDKNASYSTVYGTDTFATYREKANIVSCYQYSGADVTYRSATPDNILQRMTLDFNDKKLYVDGSLALQFADYNLKISAYPLTIFGRNDGDGTPYLTGSLRLFSMQIYDSGILKYDFVPVKNSSGVAGLYDLVAGEFYDSDSATAFTAGPVVNPVVLGENETFATWTTGALGTLNASNTIQLAMDETESATVYWMWAYEDGTTATDSSDTAVGITAVDGTVSATVTATAVFEQVD